MFDANAKNKSADLGTSVYPLYNVNLICDVSSWEFHKCFDGPVTAQLQVIWDIQTNIDMVL